MSLELRGCPAAKAKRLRVFYRSPIECKKSKEQQTRTNSNMTAQRNRNLGRAFWQKCAIDCTHAFWVTFRRAQLLLKTKRLTAGNLTYLGTEAAVMTTPSNPRLRPESDGFAMRAALRVALLAVMLVSGPLIVHADSITQTFTLAVLTPQVIGPKIEFDSTPIAQFNPADGTLNDIKVTLSGPAIWSADNSVLGAYLVAPLPGADFIFLSPVQQFFQTGTQLRDINIDLAGTDSSAAAVSFFMGTESTKVELFLTDTNFVDTFITSGLQGTITYNFTPGPPALTSEPSMLAQLIGGLIGVLALGWRIRNRVTAGLCRVAQV